MTGKERSQGDVQGHARRAPRGRPILPRNCGLGSVQSFKGRFDVDPGVRRKHKADLLLAGNDVTAQNVSQLGEESA
jgi:hypothetical protein